MDIDNNSLEWLELRIKTDESVADIVSEFLISELNRGVIVEDISPEDSGKPYVNVVAYLENMGHGKESAAMLMERIKALLPEEYASSMEYSCKGLKDDDWKESWKEYFRPVRVGKHIVVKPSWEPFVPDTRDVVVEIDPGQAFGVGTHASTALMLECMEEIINIMEQPPSSLIDVGTGTGILAITAARLGVRSVVGVDVDPEAEEAARKNVYLNHVHDYVSVTSTPLWDIEGPFEVILANIDRDTLCLLADDIAGLAASRSLLLVSGILDSQAEAVISCYTRQGFKQVMMKKHRDDTEWVCLVFCFNECPSELRDLG